MAKVVFFSVTGYGQMIPTLGVVQELVTQGETVWYYGVEDFRAIVEATGAIFQPIASESHRVLTDQVREYRAHNPTGPQYPPHFPSRPLRFPGGLDLSPLTDQLVEQVKAVQPDYVIYDAMCLWGRVLAQILAVPTIRFFASYATNYVTPSPLMAIQASPQSSEIMANLQAVLENLAAHYSIPVLRPDDLFGLPEALNLVALPRFFQPKSETFGEDFVFIGPSIWSGDQTIAFPWDRLRRPGKKLYISLGTTFSNQPTFFKECFAAFGESDWQVILSTGNTVDPASLEPIPTNFLVQSFVPQLKVLEQADLYITHGGMGSTMGALYHGVPLVVAPQMMEQVITARRVVELGLGVMLESKPLTATALAQAVTEVERNPTYRQQAKELVGEVRQGGGYQRAVAEILRFLFSG